MSGEEFWLNSVSDVYSGEGSAVRTNVCVGRSGSVWLRKVSNLEKERNVDHQVIHWFETDWQS